MTQRGVKNEIGVECGEVLCLEDMEQHLEQDCVRWR